MLKNAFTLTTNNSRKLNLLGARTLNVKIQTAMMSLIGSQKMLPYVKEDRRIPQSPRKSQYKRGQRRETNLKQRRTNQENTRRNL